MQDKDIRNAYQDLEKLAADKDAKRHYEIREKAARDWNSSIHTATEKGLQKGRQQGLEQGVHQEKIRFVQEMLAEGFDDQVIIKMARLTQAQLDEIKD